MKRIALGMTGLLVGSSIASAHEIYEVPVGELNSIGFDQETIVEEFYQSYGVKLDLHESLKITEDKEGENLRFEAFDDISIDIPMYAAVGPYNKF